MLFALPSDLTFSILQEWLVDLESISALDAAAAPIVRSEWLGLLAHPNFVLPSTAVIDECSLDFIHWISNRVVKLSALEVQASMLEQCVKISFYCLRTVNTLKVNGKGSTEQGFDLSIFQKLLKLLPKLEELDMGDFVPPNAEYLTVVSSSALSLKRIYLDNSLTSCAGVVPFISTLGANLKSVDFGLKREIDGPTMLLTASTCTNLEEFSLTSHVNKAQDFMSAFASEYLPLLTLLDLFHTLRSQAVFNDDIVRAMFLHHPLLASFKSLMSIISPATFAHIVTSASKLVEFESALMTFAVITEDESNPKYKQCSMNLYDDELDGTDFTSGMFTESILQVYSWCPYPITHLSSTLLTNEDIITVISELGADLKSLVLHLNRTVDDDSVVQQITLLCPKLNWLYLNDGDCITDLSLTAISNNCKCITRLLLHEAALVTDFGICVLLHNIGSQLTELKLSCSSLTSASLVCILSLCSTLKHLRLSKAAIPPEYVQVHLISSVQNRLPLLEELQVDDTTFVALMKFVTDSGNAVDAKWGKVLAKLE